MSDSDDTDVLLLIPPDFFIAETVSSDQSNSLTISPFPINTEPDCKHTHSNLLELKEINQELLNLEEESLLDKNITSNWCYRKQQQNSSGNQSICSIEHRMNDLSPSKLYHSTPNDHSINRKIDFNTYPATRRKSSSQHDEKFLKEIDYYLHENNPPASNNYSNNNPTNSVHTLAAETLKRHNDMIDAQRYRQTTKNPSETITNRDIDFQRYNGVNTSNYIGFNSPVKPLISLCDIWGPEGQTETLTLHEERVRREHCEKTIQSLQVQLLEYQQKISVAIKIDKSKDEAIGKLHDTNKNLATKIYQLEETINDIENKLKSDSENLLRENIDLKEKQQLQQEKLYESLASKKRLLEEKEHLETRIESLTMTSNEVRDIHRTQLEDLEKRLSTRTNIEEELTSDLVKIKNQNTTLLSDLKTANKSMLEHQRKFEECQNEMEMLKQQKTTIHIKLKEEKNRADMLEKHKKSLQQSVDSLNMREKNLMKELETERQKLKGFYQRQLEQVVGDKLKEFQTQIDNVEDQLKSDAKQRELLIAERAIKQMELINQKNEQELALINEKHNEEIELYRIQLANAASTIKQLQDKLNGYQSRRANIAEQLHNVMETQWQKALEIITSPSDTYNSGSQQKTFDAGKLDKNKADGVAGLYQNKAENEIFETPTTSRNKKRNGHIENMDKLHAYIELLLQKSPNDLENLDGIMCKEPPIEPTNNAAGTSKSVRKDTTLKRPWK